MTDRRSGGNNRRALDGASRRRLYLFRHGAVDYLDENGAWVEDANAVNLNAYGRAQAEDRFTLLTAVHRDYSPLFAPGVLRGGKSDAMTTLAQTILYNANPQRPQAALSRLLRPPA